jgi:hypothetical protein
MPAMDWVVIQNSKQIKDFSTLVTITTRERKQVREDKREYEEHRRKRRIRREGEQERRKDKVSA